jgi:hypothetical protein
MIKRFKSIFKKKTKKPTKKNADTVNKIKLKCFYKSICATKAGNSIEENEDSIFEPNPIEFASKTILKFAISDGATESSFAKEWSQLLVRNYTDKLFDRSHFQETIKQISQEWHQITNAIELPWYAQQKIENGAFATFLGVTIDLQNHNWQSIAVGDSTLFHIRNNSLLDSFPIKTSDEYGNTPKLISSAKNRIQDFDFLASLSQGEIISGDLLIAGTDAISAWIFKQIENGGKPWEQFEIFYKNNFHEFDEWLYQKRNSKEVKNDDITLLFLKFE